MKLNSGHNIHRLKLKTAFNHWHRSVAVKFKLAGPRLNIKTIFPGMGIPMFKIRWSRDHLIFNMGIPILVRRHLYIETAPRSPVHMETVNIDGLVQDCINTSALAMESLQSCTKPSIDIRDNIYRKTSNISHIKSPNLKNSRIVLQLVVFAQSIEARCQVGNEDVGAVPTGDAPTPSQWPTILLPTNVQLILEI